MKAVQVGSLDGRCTALATGRVAITAGHCSSGKELTLDGTSHVVKACEVHPNMAPGRHGTDVMVCAVDGLEVGQMLIAPLTKLGERATLHTLRGQIPIEVVGVTDVAVEARLLGGNICGGDSGSPLIGTGGVLGVLSGSIDQSLAGCSTANVIISRISTDDGWLALRTQKPSVMWPYLWLAILAGCVSVYLWRRR